MAKRVLITGMAGFVGYHLFRNLSEKGNEVIGLDNFDHPCGASVDCIKGDVTDSLLVNKLIKDVDEVYHLAAQINVDRSYKQKNLTFEVNVNGTKNVVEACKRYNKKMIFASTSEVYGTARDKFISEDHPLNPQSPYAASKKVAEELCIKYAKEYKTKVVILRCFNTYGPYQNMNLYGAVIPVFFKRVLNNQPPEVYLPGTQTRDFMHIDDAIKSYKIASEHGPIGKPINFGSGEEISIFQLAVLVSKICGSKLKPVYIKGRPNEVMRLAADISGAKKLGFKPKITIKEGLEKYFEWIKANYPIGL